MCYASGFSASRTWTGAVSSNWSEAGNWIGGVPGISDTAVFTSTYNVNCQVDQDIQVGTILATSAYSGTLFLNSYNFTVYQSADFSLFVSAPDRGSSKIIMIGDGEFILHNDQILNQLEIQGQTIMRSGDNNSSVRGEFIISGTLTLDGLRFDLIGATLNNSGEIASTNNGYLVFRNFTYSNMGTLNIDVIFRYFGNTIPAATYGRNVKIQSSVEDEFYTLGPGSIDIVGDFIIEILNGNDFKIGLDASVHNPDVNIAGSFFVRNNIGASILTVDLKMGSGTWTIEGDSVKITEDVTLDRGTSALVLQSETVQVLTGSPHILPPISKRGSGTLRLSGATINTFAYSQDAGTLDFNGQNLTTLAYLNVLWGNSSSFANLGGRTITVGSNCFLLGNLGDSLNLNPTTNWSLNVGGTLTAQYAKIGRSQATGTQGRALLSSNQNNNSNWVFQNGTKLNWTNGAGTGLWTNPANWHLNITPTWHDTVVFSGSYNGNSNLDDHFIISSLMTESAYSGIFNFGTYSLDVMGDADFSGFATAPEPGTGKLIMSQPSVLTLHTSQELYQLHTKFNVTVKSGDYWIPVLDDFTNDGTLILDRTQIALSGGTFNNNGSIEQTSHGILNFYGTQLGTMGVLNSEIRFQDFDYTIPAMSYGKTLSLLGNQTSATTFTFGAGIFNVGENLEINIGQDHDQPLIINTASNPDFNIGGDFIISNDFIGSTRTIDFTMGSGDWTVGGDLLFNSLTPISEIASLGGSLRLTGSDNIFNVGSTLDNNLRFRSISFEGTYTLPTNTRLQVYGSGSLFKVSDTLNVETGALINIQLDASSDFTNGTIQGDGVMWFTAAQISPLGTIDIFVGINWKGIEIPARNWERGVIIQSEASTDESYILGPGHHLFKSNLTLAIKDNSTSNQSVDAALHNPDVTIHGNFVTRDTNPNQNLRLNMGSGNWVMSGDTLDLRNLGVLDGGQSRMFLTSDSITHLMASATLEYPPLIQTGQGRIQIEANTLRLRSYTQNSGSLNLNNHNLDIVSDFYINNGGSNSLVGLENRTITVAGDVALNGSPNSLLNLSPGASWNIAVNGSLTADYALIGNSNSQLSTGIASINSIDDNGNTNWTFLQPLPPMNSTALTWDTDTLDGFQNASGNWSDRSWSDDGSSIYIWVDGLNANFEGDAGNYLINLDINPILDSLKILTPGFTFNGGTLSFNGPTSIIHTDHSLIINSAISGNNGFTKTGDDTLFINTHLTQNGDLVISEGVLDLKADMLNNRNIQVDSGAVFHGLGVMNGTLSIQNHGVFKPAGITTGYFGVRDLIFAESSVLEIEVGASMDNIGVSDDLVLDGFIKIKAGPGFGHGRFNLISYGGSLTNLNMQIGEMPAGYHGSVEVSSNNVYVNIYTLPVFTTEDGSDSLTLNSLENEIDLDAITATDPDGGSLTYSLGDTPDAIFFTLDRRNGTLEFINPPNYEQPLDANQDNIYELILIVSDEYGGSDSLFVSVQVQDEDDLPVLQPTMIEIWLVDTLSGTAQKISIPADSVLEIRAGVQLQIELTLSEVSLRDFNLLSGQVPLGASTSLNNNTIIWTWTSSGSGLQNFNFNTYLFGSPDTLRSLVQFHILPNPPATILHATALLRSGSEIQFINLLSESLIPRPLNFRLALQFKDNYGDPIYSAQPLYYKSNTAWAWSGYELRIQIDEPGPDDDHIDIVVTDRRGQKDTLSLNWNWSGTLDSVDPKFVLGAPFKRLSLHLGSYETTSAGRIRLYSTDPLGRTHLLEDRQITTGIHLFNLDAKDLLLYVDFKAAEQP
jgi:hypothetical protein